MARRGKPAIVSWGGDRLDVFVRTERDELLHQWSEGTDGATERIGGPIASDPVAAAYGEDLLSVFVLSPSQSLLHWSWNPGDRRMHGPDDWGRLATPPMPISWQPGQLDVLARSIDVRGVRRWILTSQGELTGPLTMDVGSGVDPVPVSHTPGTLDVLFWSDGLEHRRWNGSDLVVHARREGNIIARPVAVSWGRNRIDVFARTADGIVTHWEAVFTDILESASEFSPFKAAGGG